MPRKINSVLISGAAGFLGSHLTEYYLNQGCQVIGIDNLITGNMNNIKQLRRTYKDFIFMAMDVNDFRGHSGVDLILHFASPASPNSKFPSSYFANPLMTIHANVNATERLMMNMRPGARFVFASTSEIYGDPEIHPQPESYSGNVNSYSPRSIYDESKRMGETITSMGKWKYDLDTGIVRIFNTYGPRIPEDGRVISNFIIKALNNERLEVYGGTQTRSFLYIDDLIDGIVRVANCDLLAPVNIGSSEEITIAELATKIVNLVGSGTAACLPDDMRETADPQRRKADTARAEGLLDWKETVSLEAGLEKTIEWFKEKYEQKV